MPRVAVRAFGIMALLEDMGMDPHPRSAAHGSCGSPWSASPAYVGGAAVNSKDAVEADPMDGRCHSRPPNRGA